MIQISTNMVKTPPGNGTKLLDEGCSKTGRHDFLLFAQFISLDRSSFSHIFLHQIAESACEEIKKLN